MAGGAGPGERRLSGPVIWVVDDDPALRHLATVTLASGLRAEVVAFGSPLDAIAAMEHAPRPSVLLTDFSMPEVSGVELARVVRARFPGVRVVVLSAVEKPPGVDDAVERWLVKPQRPSSLVSELKGLAAGPPTPTPAPVLEGLRARYAEHLRATAAQVPALAEAAVTPEGERALRDLLHQLMGTAGSYGFSGVSEAASALRGAILAGEGRPPALVTALVDALRQPS